MRNGLEMLTRVYGPGMSPFLICNLLARRVRQLANGQQVAEWSGLVNVAVTEFLEGRLLFEVNGQRVHSSRDAQTAETGENEERSAPQATRVRDKGKLHPEADHLEISSTVPVGR
jgi:DNA-directed RNA polymerase subunit K/omega